jgi:cytochrome c oxidase subunit 2
MKINVKSLAYTVIIVGAFVFLCFRADKVPVIGSYLGGDLYGEQSTLNPDGVDGLLGPIAQSHYDSFMLTLWITALLCITVGGPFVYALFAFKEKKGFDPKKDKLPKQTHGNTKVEVSLIFYSIILLLLIAFLPFGKEQIPSIEGIAYFFEGKSNKHKITLPEKDPFTINVTGHQWWFSFHYPKYGVVTSNEMVFPINTPIKINLISADVIHSFWLAKIAGKVDLMPGQTNSMWLYTENEGNYSGQCAEYCGDSHAYMLFRGIATTQDKFDKWVTRQKELPEITKENSETFVRYGDSTRRQLTKMEALGERLFNGDANTVPEQLREAGHTTNSIACIECHNLAIIPAPDWAKPNLLHFAERTTIAAGWRDMNKAEIKKWVQQPGKVKPGNRMWKTFAERYKIIDGNTTQDLWNRKKTEANASHSFFTDEEAEAIAAFLLTLKHPEAPDWNELYGKPIKARKKEPTTQDPDKVKASEKSTKDKLAKN